MTSRPDTASSDAPGVGAWRDLEDFTSSLRVAFIEGDEPRMLRAAARAQEAGLCRPVLMGDRAGIERAVHGREPDIVDISDRAVREQLLDDFERHTGHVPESGRESPMNPALWGAMLVRCGWVDAAIGGARTTSADMLRAGLSCIGLATDRRTVSGAMFLDTQRPDIGSNGTLAFADAVVTPLPTIEQLVDIAAATAQSWRALMKTEPRIGFLSFSTQGSSASSHVTRIREAVALFKQSFPGEVADGELQFDSAVSKTVAQRKHAVGEVAGTANILIFPSLDSANIAYKVAEQLGGARARGLLQGLAQPFADVSRGAGVDDIVMTVRMLLFDALQRLAPESSRREGVRS